MTRRGQGAFEYILMLSGVLLVVILILLILQGSITTTNSTLTSNQNQFGSNVKINFVNHRTPNLFVTEATGGIASPIPCCSNANTGPISCVGPNGLTSAVACDKNLTCPSKQFNNASGICG